MRTVFFTTGVGEEVEMCSCWVITAGGGAGGKKRAGDGGRTTLRGGNRGTESGGAVERMP